MSEDKLDLPRLKFPDKIKRAARSAITGLAGAGVTMSPVVFPESNYVDVLLPEQQQARSEVFNKINIPDILSQRLEAASIDEVRSRVDTYNNQIAEVVKRGIDENNVQQLVDLSKVRRNDLVVLMKESPSIVRPLLLQEKLTEDELVSVQNIEGLQVEVLRQIEGEYQLQAIHYRGGGERIVPNIIAQDQEFTLYSLYSDRFENGEVNIRDFEIGSNVIAQGYQLGSNIFVDSLSSVSDEAAN